MTSLLLSSSHKSTLEEAAQRYEKSRRLAKSYLEARGISELAASTFRLGYVEEPLVGHSEYRGRLAIPYVTPAGVVGFRFRCVGDHDCKGEGHPKYLQPPAFGTRLFNVRDLFS